MSHGGQRQMRSVAVGGRRSSSHAVIITARFPVRPDSRNDLDVREIWQLLGQRERVCAIALRITLRKGISGWDVTWAKFNSPWRNTRLRETS